MADPSLVAFLALLALSFVLILILFLFVKARIRRIWKELHSLTQGSQSLRKEITNLRKQLFIVQAGKDLRLPPLLPSEDGEEIILYNFFDQKRTGFFVEVGAFNGVELSNTYLLEALGWTGILIEPHPELYKQCVPSRPFSKVLNVAASDQQGTLNFTIAVGSEWLSFSGNNPDRESRVRTGGGSLKSIEVPALTLNEILKDCSEPIDLISIDVEGYELNVMRGLDFERFRPKVFLIERPLSGDDKNVDEFLKVRGYEERFQLGSNSFYVLAGEKGSFHW